MTIPVTKEYSPDNPNILFGLEGLQKFLIKNDYSYYSKIKDEITDINLQNKFCVDNSWNSQIIYLSIDDKVYKLNEKGEVLSFTSISGCKEISVIQGTTRSDKITSELGFWVHAGENILKYDSNLALQLTVGGFENLKSICSTWDGGCYIADDEHQIIIKIDKNGQQENFLFYSDISPSIVPSNLIKELKVDHNEDLWILAENYIYRYNFNSDGEVIQRLNKDLSFLKGNTFTVSSFDLDRWGQNYEANESSSSLSISEDLKNLQQYVYISAGDYDDCKVAKIDRNGFLISSATFQDYGYPILIKTGQSRYSNSIYILTDRNQFVEFDSGWDSSSSSSSSSSIDPGLLYAVSTQTSRLYQIDLTDFSRTESTHHIVYGSRAATYDRTNDKLYYLSYNNDDFYYFNFAIQDNILVGNGPATAIHRLCLSPNNQYLWASKGSTMYICSKSNGTVVNTINLVGPSSSSLGEYGGMDIDSTGTYLYLFTNLGLWRTLASNITTTATTATFEFLGNPPSNTSNYITGISFSNDGTAFVIDYVGSQTRLFVMSILNGIPSYQLKTSYDVNILEDLTGGYAL